MHNVNSFLDLEQVRTMSSISLRAICNIAYYSLNVFVKLGTSFFCRKFSHVSHDFATFNSESTYLASDEAFKNASCIASKIEYLQVVNFGELDGHCFFWIICIQFACRHSWATHAVCAEPHASHWIICCSVQQHSVAVFNKFWKTNSFNYCL